jgi:ribosomal protein S1
MTLLTEWDRWNRESAEWQQEWFAAKHQLRIGTIVSVKVVSHESFGVFATIEGIPFLGLISTTEFKDDGRMTLEEYPPVGAVLDALVLGPNEHQRQMRLGVKPSHLGRV